MKITFDSDNSNDLKLIREILLSSPQVDEVAEVAEVDKDGRAWDERIDSSSKALTADKRWRARKKPKEYVNVEDWENFRREVLNESTVVEEVVPCSIFDTPYPVVEVVEDATPWTFDEMLDGATKLCLSGQITSDKINEFAAFKGCENILKCEGNPDAIDYIVDMLNLKR